MVDGRKNCSAPDVRLSPSQLTQNQTNIDLPPPPPSSDCEGRKERLRSVMLVRIALMLVVRPTGGSKLCTEGGE